MATHPLVSLASWTARHLPDSWRRAFYRVPPLARFLRRQLNQAVPEGRGIVEVAAGGLQGARLNLDLHKEKDYWLGTYETELQEIVRDFVRPGQVVYDVGANIGYISLLMARAVGSRGQVFAFEALPDNVARLRENLALNDFASGVEVVPAAVVDRGGQVRFLVHDSTSMGKVDGSVGRSNQQYPGELWVAGVSLDEFVFTQGRPAPDVVKMDIEGGEVLALPGMQRILQTHPPLLLVELHSRAAAQTAWDLLAPLGYQLCAMTHGAPTLHSAAELDERSYVIARPPE